MKSRFVITDEGNLDNTVTLEVDTDVLTLELAREIVEFSRFNRDALKHLDGDYLRTVVRLFGAMCLQSLMAEGGVSFGPAADDEESSFWTRRVLSDRGHEGWPQLEQLGMRIVAVDVSAPDFFDVTMEEVAHG